MAYATDAVAVSQAKGPRIVANAKAASVVARWFLDSARDLPWRRNRTPYGTLVSETMAQQTQVMRVVPAWSSFMRRFPTVAALARADEKSVLRAWRGLGYYRRARNLHQAAKILVRDYNGCVPAEREALLALPGIGPYSAGAIGSMGFGRREPIVDGNVARVLLRLHGRRVAADARPGSKWLWSRAREYIEEARDPASANEGLMELGAIVCTPRSPKCGECPLRNACVARRLGEVEQIPRRRATPARPSLAMAVVIVKSRGAMALVRRGAAGLWAELMFPPTLEGRRAATVAVLARRFGVECDDLERRGEFDFPASSRKVRISVWRLSARASMAVRARAPEGWMWLRPKATADAAVASAMQKILQVDRAGSGRSPRSGRVAS